MKKFSKILSLFVIACAFFAAMTVLAAAEIYSGECGTDGDNVTWSLDTETCVLTISGEGEMEDYGSSWSWLGEYVKTVVIESGVTYIGRNVFAWNENLTSVTIPNSVVEIGEGAFSGCSSLMSVTIPDSVKIIGYEAFSSCESLIEVVLGKGVTEIGDNAFAWCSNLADINLPSSLTSIGDGAFCNCAFTEITIPGNVTSIDEDAFRYCYYLSNVNVDDANTVYKSVDGVLYSIDMTQLVFYPINNPTTVLVLPNGLKEIPSSAFYSCYNLVNVVIPSSVTSIGKDAFLYCDNLVSVDVDAGNAAYASKEGVLFNKEKTELILYPAANMRPAYVIPNGVTKIHAGAFTECDNLIKVTIPNGVTSIGEEAFSYCEKLVSISIPSSVTSIGERAFYACKGIRSITVPGGVKTIYYSTFGNCHKLESIALGEGVETIESSVFYNCKRLKSVTIPSSVTSISEGVFGSCSALESIDVAAGNDSYVSVDGVLFTKDMTELIAYPPNKSGAYTVPSGVKTISREAFEYAYKLNSITIPESVTDIGYNNFIYCDELVSITVAAGNGSYASVDGVLFTKDMTELIRYPAKKAGTAYTVPDSVHSISRFASYGNNNLISVTFGDNVGIIEYNAFAECENLVTVSIGSGAYNVEDAFNDCPKLANINVSADNEDYVSVDGVLFSKDMTKLLKYPVGNTRTSYTVPNGVTVILSRVFDECNNLTSITLPGSVTTIEYSAFENCVNLKTVNLSNGLIIIEDTAFDGCESLNNITIPDTVKSIGYGVFLNCTSLTSITVPGSLKSIPSSAFEYCTSLKTVIIKDGVTSIGEWAFAECEALTSVTIPGSVTSIGSYAFSYCHELKNITIPSSVASIGECAFESTGISSITVPGSVKNIGEGAFGYCGNLTSINVDSGNTAYASVDGVLFNKDMTVLMQYPGGKTNTSYTIPSSVTSISQVAFRQANKITSFAVAGGNTAYSSADGVLFNKDKSVIVCYPAGKTNTSYSIPGSVKEIGGYAFYDARFTSLTIPNSVTSIGSHAIYSCDNLTALSVPSSVTSFGSYAFAYNNKLVNITLPDNMQGIGYSMFSGCRALASINIPSSVEVISDYAFRNCDALTNVTVPSSVVCIGARAFNDCDNLVGVTIPGSVISIGEYAFNGCDNLTIYGIIGSEAHIYANENNIPFALIGGNALASGKCGANLSWQLYSTGDLLVTGSGAMYDYSSASQVPWNSKRASIKNVSFSSGITSIGGNAFNGCTGITSISIPDGVSAIGTGAFLGCTNLENIVLGSGLESIGASAFENCTKLESVSISKKVTSIGNGAFKGCTALTIYGYTGSAAETYATSAGVEFVPLDPVTVLGEGECGVGVTWKFYDNGTLEISGSGAMGASSGSAPWEEYKDSITRVVVKEGVTGIPSGTFANLKSVVSISVPSSVTSIGTAAFMGCTALEHIVVSADNAAYSSVDGVLFSKDKTTLVAYPIGKADSTYSIPSSVSTVGSYSFVGASLEKVTVTGNVRVIENNAFAKCEDLTGIVIPEGVTTIGDRAFSGCTSLESVTLPTSVTSIGTSTFASCGNVTIRAKEGSYAAEYADDMGIVLEIVTYTPGDADEDGNVTIRDAARILQYKADWDVTINLDASDVDGDGNVTIRDAARILQYKAGWDVTLG